jgi:hypothetical protein
MNPIYSLIKKIKTSIKKKIDKIIELLALHFIFIIGIGFTTITAKLFLKNFLPKRYSFTSWKKHVLNKNINKMY